MKHFLLYSRPVCPLCVKMKQTLENLQTEFNFTFEEVDIEQDDALMEQYMLMIPVLAFSNETVCYGKMNIASFLEVLGEE